MNKIDLMIILSFAIVLGVIFVPLLVYSQTQDSVQIIKQEQYQDKIISAKIENMSCTQLHDALLHNTINGTDHIQRASERYIASCESK